MAMRTAPPPASPAQAAEPFDRILNHIEALRQSIAEASRIPTYWDGMEFLAEDLRSIRSQVQHMRKGAIRRAQATQLESDGVPPALALVVMAPGEVA